MTRQLSLTDSRYTLQVKLPKWNGPQSADTAGHAALRKAIRQLGEKWTRADHAEAAEYWRSKEEMLGSEYSLLADQAFVATLGRLPEFGDYKISAIWSEDLHEADKTKLRQLARDRTTALYLYRAHNHLARYWRDKTA